MSYEGVQTTYYGDVREWIRRAATVINQALLGKINTVFTATLTQSSTTTTVTVPPGILTNDSFIGFMPTTANAATAYSSGGFYVSDIDAENSQFTITHPSTADADKTFTYVVLG